MALERRGRPGMEGVQLMTEEEQVQLKSLRAKEAQEQRDTEFAADEARYEGYMFWCNDGCGFVSRHHRCEQWSSLTYISPKLQEALRQSRGG